MAKKQVNPTRMELNQKKNKLLTAQKGHKLLKDKRDELMRRFLELNKLNKSLRFEIADSLYNANMYLMLCRSEMTEEEITTSLLYKKGTVDFTAETRNIMSVIVPKYSISDNALTLQTSIPYSYCFTSVYLDRALEEIYKFSPKLIKLCECEQACFLISQELEKTRRRVNALEHFIIPDYQREIKYIKMKLEENQRSTQVRLMKVKDMMLEKAHNFKK